MRGLLPGVGWVRSVVITNLSRATERPSSVTSQQPPRFSGGYGAPARTDRVHSFDGLPQYCGLFLAPSLVYGGGLHSFGSSHRPVRTL